MKKILCFIILFQCVSFLPAVASDDQPALADAIQILKMLTISEDPWLKKISIWIRLYTGIPELWAMHGSDEALCVMIKEFQ